MTELNNRERAYLLGVLGTVVHNADFVLKRTKPNPADPGNVAMIRREREMALLLIKKFSSVPETVSHG